MRMKEAAPVDWIPVSYNEKHPEKCCVAKRAQPPAHKPETGWLQGGYYEKETGSDVFTKAI